MHRVGAADQTRATLLRVMAAELAPLSATRSSSAASSSSGGQPARRRQEETHEPGSVLLRTVSSLFSTKSQRQEEIQQVSAWLQRAQHLKLVLPPTVERAFELEAPDCDRDMQLELAEDSLPPLCNGVIKGRAFLYKDDEIGFRPSVLRGAPSVCRFVSLSDQC